MNRYISFILAISSLLLIPLHISAAPVPPPLKVQTTLPWITSMSKFIVGTTVQIVPIAVWNESGALKNLRKPDHNIPVISLDPRDSLTLGIKPEGKNVFLLYNNLPVRDAKRGMLPYDPSVLPFVSQRLLIVISELSPDNYAFYQRRLAEFQSRMESTLEVGRSLIKNVNLLDLTGAVSPWLQSASDNAVRPPDDLWMSCTGGTRLDELKLAIEEANKRGWWIVLDAWTPAPIRGAVGAKHKSIHIASPTAPDYDFFTYLHDIYLKIWTATAKK